MRYMLVAAFAALMIAPAFANTYSTSDTAGVTLTVDAYATVNIVNTSIALATVDGTHTASASGTIEIVSNANGTVAFSGSILDGADSDLAWLDITTPVADDAAALAAVDAVVAGGWSAVMDADGAAGGTVASVRDVDPGDTLPAIGFTVVAATADAWENTHAGDYTGTLTATISVN